MYLNITLMFETVWIFEHPNKLKEIWKMTVGSSASLEINTSGMLKIKKSSHPPQGGKKGKEVIWLLRLGVLLGETHDIPEDNPTGL